MAKVDYYGLKQELREVVAAKLDNVTVTVEKDMQFASELTPWVGVYLEGRDIPEDQPIAAGRISRIRVRLSIWLYTFSLELEEAERARDSLLGEIELILMENRTLNDKVEGLLLDGGELSSNINSDTPGFFSSGEIKILADVTAEVN